MARWREHTVVMNHPKYCNPISPISKLEGNTGTDGQEREHRRGTSCIRETHTLSADFFPQELWCCRRSACIDVIGERLLNLYHVVLPLCI
jgi:hypothetical protein